MAPVPTFSRDPVVQAYLKLATSNVSDALDRLQLKGAPHGLLPLWPGCQKIVGRAMTMKLTPEGSASPVLGTLEAIMAAQPGDVLVIDQAGRMDVNSWGGIATFTAVQYGLVGVVIDGVTRDVDEMKALSFPAYAKGIIQQSIRNRCAFAGHSIEVQVGGVAVRAGDLVMGDDNGIVIVPQEHIADALKIAQECAEMEEKVKDWIAQGVNPLEAHERVKYDQLLGTAQRHTR
jgi:4-hydroxy-4-methyl-2-oxoglutarate aldolase